MKSARISRQGASIPVILIILVAVPFILSSCFLIYGDPVDLYMEVQAAEGVAWTAQWCVQDYYSDEDIARTEPKAGTTLESESGTGTLRWKVPLQGNWYYVSADSGAEELGLRFIAHNLETDKEHELEVLAVTAGGGSLVLYTGDWDLVSGTYTGP